MLDPPPVETMERDVLIASSVAAQRHSSGVPVGPMVPRDTGLGPLSGLLQQLAGARSADDLGLIRADWRAAGGHG